MFEGRESRRSAAGAGEVGLCGASIRVATVNHTGALQGRKGILRICNTSSGGPDRISLTIGKPAEPDESVRGRSGLGQQWPWGNCDQTRPSSSEAADARTQMISDIFIRPIDQEPSVLSHIHLLGGGFVIQGHSTMKKKL